MPKGKYDRHPELKHVEPIRLTIDAEPVAKGRPRIALMKNGGVRGYTPEKTKVAEDYLKAVFSQYKDKAFPAHMAVKLTVTFYRSKPKWLKKRETMPYKKPDTDNFVKTLCDSLNHLLVADDSQITQLNASKRWSKNGHGYIELLIEEDKLE